MKDPEVRARQSKTRREKVTSDPEYRRVRSDDMKKAWADGKYEGVKVGKCKWFDHIKPDGSIIKLQGTWEVVFAKHLDTLNIQYETHKGRIPYVDGTNQSHSYYPDFYIPDRDLYYDVKGAFFNDLQRQKFDYIRSSNPTIKLELVTRESFVQLGINIDKESRFI